MRELPKAVRERLDAAQGSNSSPHPDADTLSAFAENVLAGGEHEQVVQHLSNCSECREILALALPHEATAEIVVAAQSAKAPLHPWNVLRWAGLAAAAVTVSAAVLLYHPSERNRTSEPTTEAVVRRSEDPQQSGRQEVAPSTESTSPVRAPAATLKKSSPPPERDQTTPHMKAVAPPGGSAAETVEVAGQSAPLQSDELKPFAVSAEQSRQLVGADLAGALPKQEPQPARTAAAKIAGGSKMQSVQSQTVQAQIAPATAQASANRADQNVTENGPPNNAAAANNNPGNYASNTRSVPASSANNAAASNAEYATNRMVDKAASVEVVQDNRNTQGDSTAELRSLTAESSASAMARAATVNWRISNAGNVERSIRNGAWQPMIAAKDIHFRAVATSGRSVWAGGSNGALYRSTNSGNSWSLIPVGNDRTSIAGDITHIEMRTSNEIEVTTSAGQKWITHDDGKTWQLR